MLRATSSSGGGSAGSFSTLTVSGQGLFADGIVTAPSIAFSSEPGLGIFRDSAGFIVFAGGGNRIAGINSNSPFSFTLRADAALAWASAGIGSTDLFVQRDAPGLLGVRNSIAMRGGAGFGAKAIAGSYSVTQDDFTILCCTASQTQITVLLPANPAMNQYLNIKKVSADAGRLVIDGNGNLIDALSTQSTIATTRPSFALQFGSTVGTPTGSAWSIL